MREKITSAVFIAVLLSFFTLVVIFPKDMRASVQENRPLAEMPEFSLKSLFNGDFTTGFETYLSDNVGLRSDFVNLGTKLEALRGIQKEEAGKITQLASGGSLAMTDGKIMEVFKRNTETEETYINTINGYGQSFGNSHNVYLLLAPTQIEFDTSEYNKLSDSEKATIDNVYSSVKNVKTANAYDELKAHSDEYIYFRTDHHWTQRGAYYGYRSLMETAGYEAVDINNLTIHTHSGFLGYLYNQANSPEYAKHADDIEYYSNGKNYEVIARGPDENGNLVNYKSRIYCPPTDGKAPLYSVFMGGDHAFCEIDTDVKNGKCALVIKDSYANALLPLLTNNYEKILVIDPRNYFGTVTELTQTYEIDDIIIVNYVFDTTMADFIENLNRVK